MTEENTKWATPTLMEVPFWRDDITLEEYEEERRYLAKNWDLQKQGKYVPLWKQRINQN